MFICLKKGIHLIMNNYIIMEIKILFSIKTNILHKIEICYNNSNLTRNI